MVDTLKALKEDMLAFIDPGVAEDDIEHTVSVEHHNFLRWFDALDRLSAQQREPVVRVPKFSVIMHQIALWSDDEGLDLSTGQGDALTRRIMAAIEFQSSDVEAYRDCSESSRRDSSEPEPSTSDRLASTGRRG